jgi:hypothetical protein
VSEQGRQIKLYIILKERKKKKWKLGRTSYSRDFLFFVGFPPHPIIFGPLASSFHRLEPKTYMKKSRSLPELLTLEHITSWTMKRSNLPPKLSKTVYFTPGWFLTVVATVLAVCWTPHE